VEGETGFPQFRPRFGGGFSLAEASPSSDEGVAMSLRDDFLSPSVSAKRFLSIFRNRGEGSEHAQLSEKK
jgi:hypothetical protein